MNFCSVVGKFSLAIASVKQHIDVVSSAMQKTRQLYSNLGVS